MADEAWERPDSFYQVLMVGGYVHNLTDASFSLIVDELDRDRLINVEDMYGSDLFIRPSFIVSIRHWNTEAGARWKAHHPDTAYE